jgi:hypothetical protein
VTTGNRLARLPVGLGADRPRPVPRGNCGASASGAVALGSGVRTLLAGELLCAADPERDGDGLGEGDLLGDGDGLGEGDLLGDGEGLGEDGLLGEGEDGLVEWLGPGDAPMAAEGRRARAGLAAAPALPRTAMRIPAAAAPPPASTRALTRALPGARPR